MVWPFDEDMLYGACHAFVVSVSYMLRTRGESWVTYQDFFRVADAPRQVLDIAVRLHHFGRELDAEPRLDVQSVCELARCGVARME